MSLRAVVLLGLLLVMQPVLARADSWFLVYVERGDLGARPDLKLQAEHAAWLNRHVKARIVTMAGPLDAGEMLLVRAASAVAAEQIGDSNPAIRAGYLTATISRWDVDRSVMTVARPPLNEGEVAPDRFRIEAREESTPINIDRSQ